MIACASKPARVARSFHWAARIATALLVASVASMSAQEIKRPKSGRIIPEASGSATLHRVQPGSNDNRLIVSLSGASAAPMGSDSLMVLVVPPNTMPLKKDTVGAIHLTHQSVRVVPSPQPGGEVEVEFTFDVAPDVKPAKKDTLRLMIVGRAGALLRKSVVFTYDVPQTYDLSQNYPNPFNPSTTINYQLPYSSRVNLTVYDLLGRQVKILVDEMREAGYHQAVFDASGLASGVYVYRLQATGNGSYHQVKRMLLLK
jgi:hypothetical protein